jgi:transcriptional regulator with XRE-family HTH domain
MVKRKRSALSGEATRRNLEQVARLGGDLKGARVDQRKTQAQVAALAGIGRSTVSEIERGRGGGHTLDSWQRLALAVNRPLRVELERPRDARLADAEHLAIQELVLRISRPGGWGGTFELPIGRGDARYSVDVGLRNDGIRTLAWIECWNRLDDLRAAVRSSAWKWRKAEEAAIAIGHGQPYRVVACWVVRSTRVNRALVERYPEVFASKFPGSSLGWVRSLASGSPPPKDVGLVWSDLSATRLFAWRRAKPQTGAAVRLGDADRRTPP